MWRGSLAAKSSSPSRLSIGDIIFILTLIAVTLVVIGVGTRTVSNALELEDVKRRAEQLASRFEEIAAKRKAGEEITPEQCSNKEIDGPDGTKVLPTWSDCFNAVTGAEPFSEWKNILNPDNDTYGPACDRTDEKTQGLIIIEKGTPWFSAGSTGTYYGAFDGPETLQKEILGRVSLCDRWSNLIRVREIKF
jgi:hypothetical protein